MLLKKSPIFCPGTAAALLATAALIACGEDTDKASSVEESKSGTNIELPKNVKSYETEDDMPSCASKNKSALAFVEADSVIQICKDNKWQTLGTPFETEDDVPNCTSKREGESVYLLDEGSVLTCKKGEWVTDTDETDNDDDTGDDDENGDDDEVSCSDSKSGNKSKSSSSTEDDDSETTEKSSSSSKANSSPASGLSLITLIYDSDQLVNPLFTSHGDNATYGACTGVKKGIVKTELGSDGKPQFNTGNINASSCVGTANQFNTLFNYTEDVNEVSRYDLPVEQNETTGMYFFDSDSILIDELAGGFFPVDNKAQRDITTALSDQTTCTKCRTKRTSEKSPKWGRDITEYVRDENGDYVYDEDGYLVYTTTPGPSIDYKYCSGPGWSEGIDCESGCSGGYGCFNDGNYPDVWDWGATRWEELRNHHFCMELNGQFTYKANQEAKFYVGGDLWVFINGKLAVDLGGNHLPAPGYIDMATLNSYYDGYMQTGKTYPIDVFFCARRTTVSTFAMYTNFRITQN